MQERAAVAAPPVPARPRLWTLDALRGVLVVGTVVYHLLWDLSYFGLFPVDVAGGAWEVVARAGAGVFLSLVGVSMALAAARRRSAERDRIWRRRGLALWGWALTISLVTRWAVGERYVRFGILHLIGTALLLGPWLWWQRRHGVALGLALVAAGLAARRIPSPSPWLIPLGLTPPGVEMVDYYPLLPWLGPVALGMSLGERLLGPSGAHAARAPLGGHPLAPPGWLRPFCWLGRHALGVYLVHQPLWLALLWALGYSFW